MGIRPALPGGYLATAEHTRRSEPAQADTRLAEHLRVRHSLVSEVSPLLVRGAEDHFNHSVFDSGHEQVYASVICVGVRSLCRLQAAVLLTSYRCLYSSLRTATSNTSLGTLCEDMRWCAKSSLRSDGVHGDVLRPGLRCGCFHSQAIRDNARRVLLAPASRTSTAAKRH